MPWLVWGCRAERSGLNSGGQPSLIDPTIQKNHYPIPSARLLDTAAVDKRPDPSVTCSQNFASSRTLYSRAAQKSDTLASSQQFMTNTAREKITGMGAIPFPSSTNGVAFRVWAPHANSVCVTGTFNDWKVGAHPLEPEENGHWYVEVLNAKPGDEYKYVLTNGAQTLERIDPRAREVTNSVGNSIVYQDVFDWGDHDFQMPSWNELVIYELHIGTFARHVKDTPGTFDDAISRLGYLRACGINAVEIMPVAEFAGDLSWGYNPAHIFAVETAYGGPDAFKRFIKAAHEKGIAVILDVVYNHFGPSDLALWQFDGWHDDANKGGIYFYNDNRSATPWGDTRPDYGRGEVRQFIRDNAIMWLEDYRCDGLRYDMTLYIRSISGNGDDLPEGWSLQAWINSEIADKFPNKLIIAEDLRGNDYITRAAAEGGTNFGAQWDASFVHPVREVITAVSDEERDMEKIRNALLHRYTGDAYRRVVYTESHDEVANGKARITSEVNPDDPEGYHALKRSTLGAGIVLTAPGIPMLFQGATTLADGWFQDTDPLDWYNAKKFPGISRLYRDLIHLRLNKDGHSRGLTGQDIFVHHVDNVKKLIAYHRHHQGGPDDHVLIVANFSANAQENIRIGAPATGLWKARFNSDWSGYREDLGDFPVFDTEAVAEPLDNQPASALVSVGPYSLNIYTLTAE